MPGAVVWPGVTTAGMCSDTMVSTMDIFPTVLGAAGVELGAEYIIDGRDMLPVLLHGAPTQHEVFLHYCGFNIVAARVWGRWKVWWQMQVAPSLQYIFYRTFLNRLSLTASRTRPTLNKLVLHEAGLCILLVVCLLLWCPTECVPLQNWYTNDPKNASICLECCNGINPYSHLTGATATQLCGCETGPGSRDLRTLPQPVVYDMRSDRTELHPLTAKNWPREGHTGSGNVTYAQVVATASVAKERMEAAVHPTPSASGAGKCTEGLPMPRLQPCCRGCKDPLLPMKPCHAGLSRNCSCRLKGDL